MRMGLTNSACSQIMVKCVNALTSFKLLGEIVLLMLGCNRLSDF